MFENKFTARPYFNFETKAFSTAQMTALEEVAYLFGGSPKSPKPGVLTFPNGITLEKTSGKAFDLTRNGEYPMKCDLTFNESLILLGRLTSKEGVC